MLCEECHQNEAVYTISVMMGEAMTQRHLCADCMAKMNMNIASGNMQKLLGAILNAINRGEQPEEGEKVPDDQPDNLPALPYDAEQVHQDRAARLP